MGRVQEDIVDEPEKWREPEHEATSKPQQAMPTIRKHHASLVLLLRESDDLAGEVGARWISSAAKRM